MKPRLEHIGFNVTDPAAVARWYCDQLGMKVLRKSPPPASTHLIADSAGTMTLEVCNNPSAPVPEYPSLNHNSMHLAFMVEGITVVRDSLLAADAKLVEDVTATLSGDRVLMMRDPWGLAIQFAERVTPMLKPKGIRLEHFELNVPDPQSMVKWYLEHLGMKVMRQGGPPVYGSFVADAGSNMMMEIQRNDAHPVLDMSTFHHLSIHVAFVVDDVRAMGDALIEAGATLVEDVREPDAGDLVLVLRDPWGLPIQFVRRGEPL